MITENCATIRVHRHHTYKAWSTDTAPDGTLLECPGLTRQDIRDILGDPCKCVDLDCPCDGGTVKAGHHTDPSVQVRPTAHDAYGDDPWM